jgi:hypothetical protein
MGEVKVGSQTDAGLLQCVQERAFLQDCGATVAEYSRHQKKVIRRYYENAEAIGWQRLSELVSDIYLAEGKKLDRLWGQVAAALAKVDVPQSRIDRILEQRDPQLLAQLVKELGAR